MGLLDIIVLAVQVLSLVGILTAISMLYYEQKQKEHSAHIEHIEKEVVNQELKAFEQKIQELKTLVDKQQLGTEALVKNSSEEALVNKPQHEKQPQLEKQVEKARGRKAIPVLVIDALTEEEKVYDSIEEFATQNNLNVSACRSAKNKGHMLKKRYFIE